MKVLGFAVISFLTLVIAAPAFADDMSNQYQQNTAPQQDVNQQPNANPQGTLDASGAAQGNMNQQGTTDPNGAQGNSNPQNEVPNNPQGQAGY